MGKDQTLQRVEEDIAAGNLGRARDRLHGLIWQYPDDLSLRARLAEVYWQLSFPAMAGCYWYLHEPTTEAMQRAVMEFERSCGQDPLHMLFRLKFRGNPENLPPYARYRLERLQQECQRKYGKYPDFRTRPKTMVPAVPTWKRQLCGVACFAGLMVLLFIFIAGLSAVVQAAIRLLGRVLS
ncbi:MAG: hypothetical protein RMM06_03115 [Armatimonadota bacterium]|nr:hypothetical protein [Armatimonadota bacterium]